MEVYTTEMIKNEMEGIREDDLQRRLTNYYKKRDSLKEKEATVKPETLEKYNILKENLNLRIKVYEDTLPLRIVERAKRSAGLYKTTDEIVESIKRESLNTSKDGKNIDEQSI